MSTTEEMRRVMEHAAGRLRAVLVADAERFDHSKRIKDAEVVAVIAYAEGVLDLLASYLVVDDGPPTRGPLATDPTAVTDELRRRILAAREDHHRAAVAGGEDGDDEVSSALRGLLRAIGGVDGGPADPITMAAIRALLTPAGGAR